MVKMKRRINFSKSKMTTKPSSFVWAIWRILAGREEIERCRSKVTQLQKYRISEPSDLMYNMKLIVKNIVL